MPRKITIQQKRVAIKRELEYRKKVYPKQILQGKMTQVQTDYEIAVFQSILEDYSKLKDPGDLL